MTCNQGRIAKGGSGRAQADPNVGCVHVLPMKIETDRFTLLKQSNTLLEQSTALQLIACGLPITPATLLCVITVVT